MIRRVIVITLGLLLLYSGFIYLLHDRIHRTGQTLEQRNEVKAEEFLYEDGQMADTVLVGSSMGSRLFTNNLPVHYYNLSMEALASVDGLRLIAGNRRWPRLILVETNTLDRKPDSTFFSRMDHPVLSVIRKYVPCLRTKYQPVGVFKSLLRDWNAPAGPEESSVTIDSSLLTQLVNERIGRMKHIPENEMLEKIHTSLEYVQQFERKGTHVVFYEMPTDPRLRDFRESRYIRSMVRQVYPPGKYAYIQIPRSGGYHTTDGVHLTLREGDRYTQYVQHQLRNLDAMHRLAHR